LFLSIAAKNNLPPTTPATEANATASLTVEQTKCPVEFKGPIEMGGPIDKDIFVEYQGKKVYFCCWRCKEEFEKNPEKYLTKLPQFKK
jgi:YHS domain-containing protein